jgi:cytoskeletal protein CcmA (bactofilin family)
VVGYIDVWVNGAKLTENSDFTAADGLSVVFNPALDLDDQVEMIVYGSFAMVDALRRGGDTMSGTYYTQNLIPGANNTYTLGTSNNRYSDIYLSNSSIYLGEVVLSANATNLIVANSTGGSLAISNSSFPNTGVVANTYGNTSAIPVITVDSTGRITAAVSTNVATVTGFTYTNANNLFTIQTTAGDFSAGIHANSVNNALTDTGVTGGTYGNTTAIPVITIDAKGRITNATTSSVSGVTGVSYTSANNTLTVSTSTTDFTANIQAGLDQAYSNAIAYSGNAALAYSNAVSTAAADATTKASTAYSNAVAYAASNTYVNSTFAPLAGATFTGPVSGITTLAAGNTTITGSANVSANLTAANIRSTGSVQIDGDLVVSGNTVQVNVTNLSLEDNMIYLNANNTVSHPDLGIAGNYNDGTYRHAGFFRDASDARWKFFDQYAPEPDASPYIDTSNTTFRIADIQANVVYGVTFTGESNTALTANNATNLGGQAASYYANATAPGTAYSNAVAYADTIAATAYSNAVSTASADATTKAATAYSNAVAYAAANSYVNTQLGLKASLSGATFSGAVSGITTLATGNTTITGFANVSSTLQVTGAVTLANTLNVTGLITGTVTSANNADYLDGQHGSYYANSTAPGTAYSNAVSYAATIAGTAYSNAVSYAGTIAGTAYSNAVAYAAANTYVNTQLGLKANLAGATFTGAVSVSNTLSTGNTTITGFANVSSSLYVGGTAQMVANTIMASTYGASRARLTVSAGNGSASNFRDIDLYGSWSSGEGHSISASHGSSDANLVGQITFQHDSPGSRIRFGKLYHSGDQSTYPMELVSSGSSADLRVTGNITAYYSDARLKNFQGKIENALHKVNQLNGYYFVENEVAKQLGYINDKLQVGVSAQETQAVLPEIISTAPISDEYMTVSYEKFAPLFIEAIKELDAKYQARVEVLEARIKQLEGNDSSSTDQ